MDNLTEKEKQAVKELIDELKKLYGDNLSCVILYGSKTRGDATEDSDIDIMIVLKDVKDNSKELEKVIKLTTEIDFRYETLISVTLQSEEEYLKKRSPLLLNVRKEGIAL